MTSVSKSVYIDKLPDIVNTYNNKYHQENKKKGPKFKVVDHLRVSKYQNIFAKGCTPNWSEEVFMIKKVKNTVPWTYFISDLKGTKTVRMFYERKKRKKNLIKNSFESNK